MSPPRVRQTAVAGSFYPAHADAVRESLQGFLEGLEPSGKTPCALVVPHAGWFYCGLGAARAWSEARTTRPDCVFLVGPSHRVPVDTWVLDDNEAWQTPLGTVAVDTERGKRLAASSRAWSFDHRPHRDEHSLEVLVPWVQYLFPGVPILPVVGNAPLLSESEPALATVLSENVLFVVSSDLSHFHTRQEAEKRDRIFLEQLVRNDLSQAGRDSACGLGGLKTLASLARSRNWTAHVLDYRTSAVASGDESRVVGYAALAYWSRP